MTQTNDIEGKVEEEVRVEFDIRDFRKKVVEILKSRYAERDYWVKRAADDIVDLLTGKTSVKETK